MSKIKINESMLSTEPAINYSHCYVQCVDNMELLKSQPTKKNGKTYWNSPYSPPRDWIDINALPQAHTERNGYPTQKPKELIKRFVLASSNENDVVADYYLGSGTTAEVCKDLNRKFIGCDISEKAIEITRCRVQKIKL